MKRYIFIIYVIITSICLCYAVDPNCPRCHGTGIHSAGGSSISHVNVVCRNCGQIYDGFYSHQCSCANYGCANYQPSSANSSASWDDDIGYVAAQEYYNQNYSDGIYEEENSSSNSSDKISSKKHYTRALPNQTSTKKDDGIPSWIWIAGICIVAVIGKFIFDD